jgi:Kef-type K+ transport system membrane component KefB
VVDVLVADVIGAVALVLLVSAVLGAAARRLGQPAVIGQLIAGILLGPTLLGQLPGHLTSRLFPAPVLPYLTVIAQIAVVIFMFVVGYELDLASLQGRRRAVPFIAVAALVVPMALGAGSVLAFRSSYAGLGHQHTGLPLVLFLGVAVSITALPVLAAIVSERGMTRTVAGGTATAAAGIMDAAAWLVLAVVLISTVHQAARPWPVVLLLFGCFVVVMLAVVRPALRWWLASGRGPRPSPVVLALVLALGAAWVTATLGLHPVFGAFLAGLTMPRPGGDPDPAVLTPMRQIGGLLLPLFFVVTGLSLNVGSLTATAVGVLVLVCAIAIGGKMLPGYLAARAGGLGTGDSATVAVLVNTRGLTELIALNVGRTDGLIGPELFTVLVIMAVVTTLATVPLLTLLRRRGIGEASPAPPEPPRAAGAGRAGEQSAQP